MSEMKAIIYTRPKPVTFGDYTFFARPAELKNDEDVSNHIRNVMAEDDCGVCGEIVGKRWHVMRTGNNVIVGMATRGLGRTDELGRVVRGYYGFFMPSSKARLPSAALFDELDRRFVIPRFENANITPIDTGFLSGGLFDDLTQYKMPSHEEEHDFNLDGSQIKFHFAEDVPSLLLSAVACAMRNERFEIVTGLNTIDHAKKLHIMNCLCYTERVSRTLNLDRQNRSDSVVSHEKKQETSVLGRSGSNCMTSASTDGAGTRRARIAIDVPSSGRGKGFRSLVDGTIRNALRFLGVRGSRVSAETSSPSVPCLENSDNALRRRRAARRMLESGGE